MTDRGDSLGDDYLAPVFTVAVGLAPVVGSEKSDHVGKVGAGLLDELAPAFAKDPDVLTEVRLAARS